MKSDRKGGKEGEEERSGEVGREAEVIIVD